MPQYERRKKMKRLVALTLSLVMLLALFTGCTKTETETTTTSGEGGETTAASGEGEYAGKTMRTDIIYGTGFDIVTFDPQDANDGYSGEAFNLIYSRLMHVDEEGVPVPDLCESYEQPSDTEYIFHLHEGVKFHNGDTMTADDVVFSLERARNNPKSAATMEGVDVIEAVDDLTVRLTTTEPFAPLLLNLGHTQTSILNKKYVEEAEAAGKSYGTDVEPVGTGVMKYKEYAPNDHFTAVRFDDYFKGATRTTSVTRRVIPEASSLTIALENGEIDYIDSLNSIDIDRIKENPNLKTVEMVSANIAYLGFNTTKEPFDDPLVRRALQYASNKEAIVEVLYEGYGIPCTSVFPTIGVAFNDELDMYTYDIDKAKELLVKAGHADGFSFEITVSSDIRSRAAQLLQQDFAQIGVTVDINQMEFGAMLDYLSGKNHEGWIMSWGGATNPNMTLTNNFHTESGGATGNRMWYSNPEVDRLIEEARAEMDADKRNEMYKEVQAILMEDSPWVPLLQQTYVAGMAAGTDGMIMYKTGSRYYHNMVVYE